MTDGLVDAVERFPGARILVLGDVMLDRYIVGAVSRISPEAPVPVVRIEREDEMVGGAGNVARNVAALGAACTLIGIVGADREGETVVDLLERAGIVARLVRDPARCTTVKTRIIGHHQQIVRADRETVRDADALMEAALRDAVEEALGEVDVLVVSDYGKGVLTPGLLRAVYEAACAAGIPTITDPTGRDFSRYAGTSYLKPNRSEVTLATGLGCEHDAAAEVAGAGVIDITGASAVLISRSEQGISVVRAGAPAAHLRAEAREVFDVSGAGDTVVATAAVALAAGADIVAAAGIANAAAGIVVGKLGTGVVEREELRRALSRPAGIPPAAKVVSRAEAAARAAAWKAQGLTVGFTNGCFDLLHPGHVALLASARAACDRLIVALNDDDSIRRLKGPTRPVTPQDARAAVMAALEAVDLVTLFEEDTPLELIEAVRPDVLVKGGDYRPDQVVGRETVEAIGGRVVIVPLVEGFSTTATIGALSDGTTVRP